MIGTVFTVWCDGDDCAEWIAQEPTVRAARAAAKRAGWARFDRLDYCPRCRARLPSEPPKEGRDR